MGLNALAFRYAQFVESAWYWPYPVLMAGFLLGLLWPSGPLRIRRGPHWAIYLLLLLAYNLLQFQWLGSNEMIRGGYLWAGAAVDIASGLLCGGLGGFLAKARSRDAFGHAGWAILGGVPLLNLVLLASPSRTGDASQGPVLFAGLQLPTLAWVVTVFAISATSRALTGILETELEYMAANPPSDDAYSLAVEIMMIEANGLEAYLDIALQGVEVPKQLDSDLWLIDAQRDGVALHFTYAMAAEEGDTLSKPFRDETTRIACDALGRALQAGAAVEYHYLRLADKTEFDVISVRAPDCLI